MDEADAAASPTGVQGRFQYFEGTVILWSTPTGAHLVQGKILTAFEGNGREAALGYPVGDEEPEGGGFRQRFEKAVIHWTSGGGSTIERL